MRYAASVQMQDVTFTVAPAGLRRFREQGQKNVHAWVRGRLVTELRYVPEMPISSPWWVPVRYNPVDCDTFVTNDGTPVHRADTVLMVRNKIWAYNPS